MWGVWHWPLMLLVGYEYGTNYLGAPLLGLVVWCVVCFALNTLLDILYEKTECIWVPAIAHGAFNAIAALPQVLDNPADAYYNVLGPMPIGLIGTPADAGSGGLADPAADEAGRKELNHNARLLHVFVRRPFIYRKERRNWQTCPKTEVEQKTG